MTQDEFWELSKPARCKGWNFLKADLPECIDEPFFPLPENLFKALELVAPDQVKFVIVGQDPYFSEVAEKPIATGVAFGVPEGVQPPTSLARLKSHVYLKGGGRNDLTDLVATKGVLLINAALTVPGTGKRSAAGRHLKLKYWDRFFAAILTQARSTQPSPAVVAWGVGSMQCVAQALHMDWNHPLPRCVWSYHPVASKAGPNSFAQFWNCEVGKSLVVD
jgi:uracil DNA glycosylase